VLLIEDDPLLLEVLEDTLRNMGHQVLSSPRGIDAVRLMPLIDPDVMITDIIMPDFDMLEVIPELHRIRPRIKVIAVSGNPYLLTLAATRGADRVLAKPFLGQDLDNLIRSAMQ
jgi:DNA-binding response OmpR family regulator